MAKCMNNMTNAIAKLVNSSIGHVVWSMGILAFAVPLADTGLAAQSSNDRARLAALLDSLNHEASRSALDSLLELAAQDRTEDAYAMRQIRIGLLRLKLAEFDETRSSLDQAEAAFDEAAYRAPENWPWPWYGLARAKLALAQLGVAAKASMHQPEG